MTTLREVPESSDLTIGREPSRPIVFPLEYGAREPPTPAPGTQCPDRATRGILAHERAQPGDELVLGQPRRGLRGDAPLGLDRACAPVVRLLLEDVPTEMVTYHARPEDHHVLFVRQAGRDLLQEAGEVLEAMRLACGLRDPAAAVADSGVVTHVTGAPVTVRHLGFDALHAGAPVPPARDDREPSIDPDERRRPGSRRLDRLLRHESAQAGRRSTAWARSA